MSSHRTSLFETSGDSGPFFSLFEEVFVVLGAVFFFGWGISSYYGKTNQDRRFYDRRDEKKERCWDAALF